MLLVHDEYTVAHCEQSMGRGANSFQSLAPGVFQDCMMTNIF
jgi:hypothetical protein